MIETIVLLGDLKGTEDALVRYIESKDDALVDRISALRKAFAQIVLFYLSRSRSFTAAVFSDSVFVEWSDIREGRRYCLEFARELYDKVTECHLPFRVFLDKGLAVPPNDDLAAAVEQASGRLKRLMPVSTAAWSVFVAEASHLPEGIFVGYNLSKEFSELKLHEDTHDAGPFRFSKMVISQ
jgi:hypothetical protein